MDKDEKIKNAAKYWYECEKEGFPKSQEEVFKEWLKQDARHNHAYNKLKNICIDNEIDPKNTKGIRSYLIYFFSFLIPLIVLFLLIAIYY